MKKKTHWLLLLVFLLLIYGMMLWPKTLLSLHEPELVENRKLAIWPTLPHQLEELDKFRIAVDAYVTDNFPVRKYLIGALNYLRYCVGYSGTARVIVGHQGWLFYDDGSHLAQIRASTLDASARSAWAAELARRDQELNSKGVKYVVFAAPVKEHVYPEMVAQRWLRDGVDGLTDAQVLTADAVKAGLTSVLDVIPALLDARVRGVEVYSPFDTHWTGEGAYGAYKTFVDHLKATGVDVQTKPREDFKEHVINPAQQPQDLAYMLGIASFVQQHYNTLESIAELPAAEVTYLGGGHDWTSDRVIETGSDGPILLFTGDSFSSALLPLLSGSFSRIIFSHHQNGFYRDDLIDRFKPNVVLLEVIESGFRHSMPPARKNVSPP